MSYLLETLGRGLLGRLLNAFEQQLPSDGPGAIPELERRRELARSSQDLALRLGVAYLRALRLADARALLEPLVREHHCGAAALIALACVHDELGQFEEAARLLAAAADLDAQDPAIRFGLGFCYERRGDAQAAIANYRRTIELAPHLRNPYERLAALAVRSGNWRSAIDQYHSLLELDPANADALLTISCLQLQAGQSTDAIEGFQRALLIEPEATEDETGPVDDDARLAEAIQTLEDLIVKFPGLAELQVRLGDLYVKRGDDERAVTAFTAALDLQPDFLEATIKLGTQHLRRQRYAEAAQLFNRAVELNDRLLTTFVGLGVAQSDAGRPLDSGATLDLAGSLAPNSSLLFCESSRLRLKSGRRLPTKPVTLPADRWYGPGEPADDAEYEELLLDAVRRHEQAVALHPDYADLQYRLGLLYRHLHNADAALACFRRAVEINPSYVKALVKLGISLRERGESDEALSVFRRALTVSQGDLEVHYQLGLLFSQRAQFDLAVHHFEEAAGQHRADAVRHALMLALQNIGVIDRTAAEWRAICELSGADAPAQAGEERGLRTSQSLSHRMDDASADGPEKEAL